MSIVIKIVTLIGGIIGIVSAMGILYGIKDIRSGMANDDPRTTDKGIEKIVVGGAVLLAVGGVGAYVITQINGIRF
ncbi:type III secretion system protein PrgF [Enterococcus sp. S157_ASV_20]|nr:type III secretion system protein PrgF [Enterococcus sp. S157_ASV_20]